VQIAKHGRRPFSEACFWLWHDSQWLFIFNIVQYGKYRTVKQYLIATHFPGDFWGFLGISTYASPKRTESDMTRRNFIPAVKSSFFDLKTSHFREVSHTTICRCNVINGAFSPHSVVCEISNDELWFKPLVSFSSDGHPILLWA
jgi:hypothetical protein